MSKIAATDHAIHELLRRRWSPVSLSGATVAEEDLAAMLEAARWAPSCFNEQPWRYLVTTTDKPERFARAVACLADANQTWATRAGALLFGCYRESFTRNGKTNASAAHDLGAASMSLCVEATARGLYCHQMAGFSADAVREGFGVPQGFTIATAIAVGHLALDSDTRVATELRERDAGPRQRRSVAEFAFDGDWPA